jgi:hypothetical protein
MTMMKREKKKLYFQDDSERERFLEYYELFSKAEKVDIESIYEAKGHLGDEEPLKIVELSILKKVKE